MAVYEDTISHLLAHMERIDLLLRSKIVRARAVNAVDEQFQGLYISEEEVDRLLARPLGVPSWAFPGDERRVEVAEALGRLQQDITTGADESQRHGAPLRLIRLSDWYDLDTFAVDCLLICLAPELDLRYERIIAYCRTT